MIHTANISAGGKREWSREKQTKKIDAIADIKKRIKNAQVQIRPDSAERHS